MDLIRERMRAAGLHRACGGGKSSSSSSTTTNNVDRRLTGRDGAQVSGDGNTVYVSTTDHDAVMRGTELAKSAIALAGVSEASALDAVTSAYDNARNGDQRMTKMVGLVVLGLAGLAALGKR